MQFAVFELPAYFAERSSQGAYLRTAVDRLVAAEELGFDAIWVNEHHFHPHGGLFSSLPVMLAALAQRTSRVRLGTSVVVLPLHHPLEVAEQLAMVDLMSDGRLEVGVGRGIVAYDYEVMGVPLEEGQARTLEALDVLKAAWGGRSGHAGRFYQLPELEVWPQPQQRPHPPLWFSATRTEESFAAAGRLGLNLLTIAYLSPMRDIAARVGLYRQELAAAGHDPTAFRAGAHFHVLIGEDRAEACELARRAVEQHVGQSFGSHFLAKDATVRPELRALAQSADGVQVERLIEEGRLLAGTPKDCVGQVERVRRETGLDCINCAFSWGGLDDETAMRSMRLFAQEVIPLVRAHEAAAR